MELKPRYQQTDIGLIPEAWDYRKIEDLDPFVTSGSRGWAAYYSEYREAFIRITNMSRDTIYLSLTDLKFVSLPAHENEGNRTQFENGDVLISITADVGIVGYFNPLIPFPSYINQHIALVRFDQNMVNSLFVCYFLAGENSQRIFRDTTDTGAKAGMSLGAVRKTKLALPPLSERNCSRGWQRWCSGDGEVAVDEGADGVPGGLALQASGSDDGSVTGMDARPPG